MKKSILFLVAIGFASVSYAAVDKSIQVAEFKKVAFDTDATITERWKALMKLSVIKGKDSLPELEQALHSKDWFLRDGALRATCAIDENLGKKWARVLLNDPALVVRTTAVAMLRRMNDLQSKELLWHELESKKNFRFGQSLWVRKHIVETLKQFDPQMQDQRFVALAHDSDIAVREMVRRK